MFVNFLYAAYLVRIEKAEAHHRPNFVQRTRAQISPIYVFLIKLCFTTASEFLC